VNRSRFLDYCEAMFRAIWVDALDMNDPAVVGRALHQAGFDAQALLAMAQEPDVKDGLKAGHRGGGGTRRLRRPHLFCWRPDVLGPGPDRFSQGSPAMSHH
jgi:hypothetical protein